MTFQMTYKITLYVTWVYNLYYIVNESKRAITFIKIIIMRKIID